MAAERFVGEYERGYVGPKIYECRRCGVSYTHDQAYYHAVFDCAHTKGGESGGSKPGRLGGQSDGRGGGRAERPGGPLRLV